MARFKYPKFTVLILIFVLAYLLVEGAQAEAFKLWVMQFGWLGIFVTGIMYSYGFTAPIATATFLLIAKDYPFVATALVGGLGSLLGDLLIFKLLRSEFMDEIELLKQEPVIRETKAWL